MSFTNIPFRVGSPNGPLRTIRATYAKPDYQYGVEMPHTVTTETWYAISQNYPELFSFDMTVMVSTATAKRIANLAGFTDIIDISEYTQNSPYKLYPDGFGDDGSYFAYYATSQGGIGMDVIYPDQQGIPPHWLPGSDNLGDCIFSVVPYLYSKNNISTGWRFWAYAQGQTADEYIPTRFYEGNLSHDPSEQSATFYEGYTPDDDSDDRDPYNNPGEGDFDDGASDDIDTPSLPSISATDTGFITLYNPTAAQLKSLANYLWSDLFSVYTFKKLFSDPMQAILGLSILPIAVPSGGSRTVRVGNISTDVSLPVASQQFIEVNCGTITLKRDDPGTYLDFSPYTKVDLYLPFIGTHPLDVDEVMGKSINIKYHVDILSGACTAFVKVGKSVLYQFIGSCAISVPITGNDWTNAINGVMNIAGSIGSMVLTGGATAPMAAGVIASTVTNNLKPNVEKSGAISGSGGLMGVKRPYLIINRPRRNVAKNQNEFIGYPTWKNVTIGNVRGYISIEDIHLTGIPASEAELAEIKTLLKRGVIV